MKFTPGALARAVILLATLATPLQAALAQTGPYVPREGNGTLNTFWPFGMAPRTWSLTGQRNQPAMNVSFVNPSPGKLDLIFTHSARVAQGFEGFNASPQRYCANDGDPYLFLDGYTDLNADGSINQQTSVTSTKLILTPEGGQPIDLIADGTYARCGNVGQPYLRWDLNITSYRLQAWGYTNSNTRDQWYWDAQVTGPFVMQQDPCNPKAKPTVIAVQEAWWSNFNGSATGWTLGSGSMDSDGVPSGDDVVYGRTDYHADGHLPWYIVSSSQTLMCTTSLQKGTELPVQELMP